MPGQGPRMTLRWESAAPSLLHPCGAPPSPFSASLFSSETEQSDKQSYEEFLLSLTLQSNTWIAGPALSASVSLMGG